MASVGLEICSTDAYDTDRLGTFSGEVERSLTPLECARRKAQLACQLTGLDIGLGSEGSFGGGPLPGLMNWDEELLVLVDVAHGLEIVASASAPVQLTQFDVQSVPDVERRLADYPEDQAWILKLPGKIVKALSGPAQIAAQLRALEMLTVDGELRPDLKGKVSVQPDLRAMHCPQRREIIAQAAEQLLARLESVCPQCSAPDFWRRDVERGLPCAWCGDPTELPQAFILRCTRCGHESRQPAADVSADPANCPQCNP